ncbi:lactate utilization protein [Sporanaerobacter acetigenes]|uniref:Uncharacterized ACR, YkgG family COG1556 n=1 Tax=Sporanaerobacter acetigenes DSM 13106 TaxID=1123281 RepID=A0A1M5Z8Z7_9FIRM|nr:lactate utilization protein [Sporanaerobacter acetigenes]SHI20701.1 Uncharacterised ACR, YkgG family COG1556 [Sporanaerobacter acetigenes DSM 13106]
MGIYDVENKDINKLMKNLKQRNINSCFFSNRLEAKNALINKIPSDSLIAFGGSTTIKELGLVDYLINNQYKVLNRFEKDISKEEKIEIERKSLLADIFITGSNALTIDGELINMDHTGNRVSAMLFGPKKVYIVVGVNKIVNSIEEGIRRVKTVAAPLNAKRAKDEYNPPCLKNGQCVNCNSKDSICNSLVIMSRQYIPERVTIFIINEELGF